jgi:uncharacterized protein YecE (DUF72 family)
VARRFLSARTGARRELEFASRQLNSIEINGSFYSLQQPSSYQRWYDQTPDGFVFSVKGGRFITHMKRRRDVYVYFDNDAKVHAPFDAQRLAKRLGVLQS